MGVLLESPAGDCAVCLGVFVTFGFGEWWDFSAWGVFMVTIFLQNPDNFNREKTVVSKVGKIEVSFPSCYSRASLSLFCGYFC
jgi:hypothetical protein